MKRQVDVFTTGCESCEPAVRLVGELACPECDVAVHDLSGVGARVTDYGITLPAIVVDGQLLSCCQDIGPTGARLAMAGIGGG